MEQAKVISSRKGRTDSNIVVKGTNQQLETWWASYIKEFPIHLYNTKVDSFKSQSDETIICTVTRLNEPFGE